MMKQWLDSCHITNGILILDHILTWDDNATLAALTDTTKYHIDTILYHIPTTVTPNEIKATHLLKNADINNLDVLLSLPNLMQNKTAEAGADAVVHVNNSRILYINTQSPSDLDSLWFNKHFMQAINKYGYDTVVCAPLKLQGGDMLWAGDHLFLGFNSLRRFSPSRRDITEAEDSIRKFYNLKPNQTIDFIISSDSDLYHLDLFLTYAGKNKQNKDQFFIAELKQKGFIADVSAGNAMSTELQRLYGVFYAMLKHRLGEENFMLDKVPIFKGYYLISPLNGVRSCENGLPVYYMPVPTGAISTAENDSALIQPVLDSAYNIIAKRIEVKKISVKVDYLSCGPGDGGQSLHCMMSVISRGQTPNGQQAVLPVPK